MVLRFWHVKRELLSHRLSKAKALGLWIPRPLSYPLTLQFGVLFSRQVQEHPTPSSHNGLIQHQPALLIGDATASPHEYDSGFRDQFPHTLQCREMGSSGVVAHPEIAFDRLLDEGIPG